MHPPAFDFLRTAKMSRQSKQALEVKFISNAACARLVECPGKPGAALPLSVWLSRLHDAPPCLRRYLRTVKMSRQSKQALEVKFISNAACARLVECPGKPGAALPLSVWLSRLHDAPPCL